MYHTRGDKWTDEIGSDATNAFHQPISVFHAHYYDHKKMAQVEIIHL